MGYFWKAGLAEIQSGRVLGFWGISEGPQEGRGPWDTEVRVY